MSQDGLRLAEQDPGHGRAQEAARDEPSDERMPGQHSAHDGCAQNEERQLKIES
jgi:hypothetical protein